MQKWENKNFKVKKNWDVDIDNIGISKLIETKNNALRISI